ncbi:CHAP domain-containing protein [Candidatus Saccharibacteria bacterium]|nr:CHAP domain-containing protein [Candidatus Saccharibacteria bacterium]
MKTQNNLKQKILSNSVVFGLIGVIILISVLNSHDVKGTISAACRKSPECMAAVDDEKAANAAAVTATSNANFYQAKVADLNTDIAAMRRKIADTKAQIEELNVQIEETQEKLDSERNALAELLVNMHFESDVEPITVLAGSTSISDLAEKSARSEVAKQQIAVAAVNIKEAKEKLEEDKAQVEDLLNDQQIAEKDLEDKRAEQQSLVEKYQDDAEAYKAQVLAAREAQRAAEKAYRDANPGLSGVYYDGVDTYSSYIYDLGLEKTNGAYGYECPRDWDDYTTSVNGVKIGGLICECVSYVGWKAYESYGLYLAYGNAYDWKWRAEADGYRTDKVPEAGSIGWTSYGRYGHVFWVESVNSDGSIDVTDYNWNIDGSFTARTISAANVSQFYYIHLH